MSWWAASQTQRCKQVQTIFMVQWNILLVWSTELGALLLIFLVRGLCLFSVCSTNPICYTFTIFLKLAAGTCCCCFIGLFSCFPFVCKTFTTQSDSLPSSYTYTSLSALENLMFTAQLRQSWIEFSSCLCSVPPSVRKTECFLLRSFYAFWIFLIFSALCLVAAIFCVCLQLSHLLFLAGNRLAYFCCANWTFFDSICLNHFSAKFAFYTDYITATLIMFCCLFCKLHW